ncbi:MAG: HD domain-containing protein [Lachnospiraceae bacterium]|nr:HD domain-containing protein [Lachnospiraceae bacterium]
MILAMYVAAIILSIFNIAFLAHFQKRGNICFGIIFSIIFFANVGYFITVTANTLEVAMLGTKLAYIGGLFLPIFVCLIILDLSGIRGKVQRCFLIPMVCCSTAVYMMVLFYEYGDFYYKSVEMTKIDGITYIQKEYAWGHRLYLILLVGYVILNLALIAYVLAKKRIVSYKNMIYIVLINIMSMLIYLVEKLLGIKLEFIPCAYIIDSIVLLLLLHRIQMHDVSMTVGNTIEEQSGYGYVTFDQKRNYLNSNKVAKEQFPELKRLRVDRLIAPVGKLTTHIIVWMDEFRENPENNVHYFRHGEVEYKCKIRPLMYHEKKQKGYLIEILDDTKQQEYIRLLNNYNEQLEHAVEEKTAHVLAIQNQMVLGMANMVENRDFNTGGHIKRTSKVVEILVNEWKNSMERRTPELEKFCSNVIKAAPMHDLGKIAVEDRILRKPGKYTEEEYCLMKVHSEIGEKIVETVLMGVEDEEFVQIAKNIAHYHHERWDGTGYPERLRGEEIPLEARIMALADVYDALVSRRCYKEKMSYEQAYRIMQESLGTHFDPEMGMVFLRCREKLEAYYDGVEREEAVREE